MKKKYLAESLVKTIESDGVDIAANLFEVGLDSIMEDELLKDIPFVSTAVSLYKIGNSLIDRHNIKKLVEFIKGFNENSLDKKKIEKYKEKINANIEKAGQEIEYLLIILARYIGYEKPKMLSKIYLAYLDEKIKWKDLVLLSEVVDRLLPGDYDELASAQIFTTKDGAGDHIMLRLEALGLILEEKQSSAFIRTNDGGLAMTAESIAGFNMNKNERKYRHTDLGEVLISILGWRIKE